MLFVHRSERTDRLIAPLSEVLSVPAADPLAPEILSVPTRGMERWLAQRLSSRLGASPGAADGVCANVLFPSPHRLVTEAIAAATGLDPAQDPWLAERAVWPLLEVVDQSLQEPWLAMLAAHLRAGGEDGVDRASRRFSTVRRIAGLFESYNVHRPAMIREWAAGARPAEAAWQAELWRRLRARLDVPAPAERLAVACRRIREEPGLLGLPPRLSLFGLTRLPAAHLAVLRALAAGRDVHLFLLHPSPALWEAVGEVVASEEPALLRGEDRTASLPSNRLLASWGRDARELQLVLATEREPGREPFADHHHPAAPAPARTQDTLLALLQEDVRADREAAGPPLPGSTDRRPLLDPGDRSVQVHSCHGRARQVEVVRDAILHELAADPKLEPRDVIVMCPDIETFAPLIHATFGAANAEGDEDEPGAVPPGARPPDLRVRLADRSLRQTNPILGVVAGLLELAEQRVTATQVLDLADRAPVRRRFSFDDDDLSRLQAWVTGSGIRWGLDAAHRAPFKLEALHAGTWRAGLDRILLGVAMPGEEGVLYEGVLPLDDVESGAIELAGRLAELIDRLRATLDDLSTPKTIEAWGEALAAAADGLTATGRRDAWQREELRRILDDVTRDAAVAGTPGATVLALPEVRALLAGRLEGRPTRANFRTGHLTICTLMPMRAVPHRIVCLLGLDDAMFPRKSPRDGDNLILEEPHIGDRDPRAEDRQLLLDALMSATDRLIITYTGNDERTNSVRPPAVPVGELLDVIDRSVRVSGDEPAGAAAQVVTCHPLQPFDPRNFTPGTLIGDRPWGFDRVTLDGARALTGDREHPPPFLAAPLAPVDAPLVELDDLVRFAERPVRAFLRQRLGISVGIYSQDVEDALPVELDALEAWGVGQRLLEARLQGTDPDRAVAAEIARGTLPPGRLAAPVISGVRPRVEQLAQAADEALGGRVRPASIDIKVRLADGRTLSGTVAGVHHDVLRLVTYSRVSARHRLATWVRFLALTAARPELAPSAITVGRGRSEARADVTIARLPALPGDATTRQRWALAHLTTLAGLHARGLREPLPLACLSAAAYAQTAFAGGDPVGAGAGAWESAWKYDKEDREPEHQLAFGRQLTFAELLSLVPAADECGEGWHPSDPSRFGRYARRLWWPLLEHEEIEDR